MVDRQGVSDNLLPLMKNRNASPPPAAAITPPEGRWLMPLVMAAVALFALIVYRAALVPGHVILTTDDNIGALALRKAAMPASLFGWWNDSVLCGVPEFMNVTWTNILLWLLPVDFFTNWIHAIDLLAASVFLLLFFRRRGIHPAAAVLAALTSFWLGSTFFLTYAGHIGKFGVLVYAAFFLWQIECAFLRRSWAHAVLAGGGLGGMFLEQADVALFFALPFGCYALYRVIATGGHWKAMAARVFAPAMVTAALMAIHPVWMGKSLFASAVPGAAAGNDQAQWDYCTQWSWPPEETIEWIAPGYYGWRSGEPDGPYWGRLGCQPGTENQRQAGNNFKLENFYLGSLPVAFALLAIVLALGRVRGLRFTRGETLFWLGVLVVTFVLGLGKYCPVYKLFFALPGISSIRAPVKFMQVTQVALGLLAALGFDWLIRAGVEEARARAFKQARWAILAAAVILLLAGFGAAAGAADRSQALMARGWGQYASGLVSLQIVALIRGAAMMFLAWALMLWLPRERSGWGAWRGRIAFIAMGIVALDQLTVSSHYVSSVPAAGVVGRNELTDALAATRGGQRAYLFMREAERYNELREASVAYNHWLTYRFPYHNISTFNVTQIRMPDDYQQFLSALGRTPDRLWRLSAVGYLVYPTPFARQFPSLPALKDAVEPVMTFNVQLQGVESRLLPAPASQPGLHTFAKVTAPAPRYALFAGWQKADTEQTLAALADPARPLFAQVFLPPDAEIPAATGSGITGRVEVVSYRSGSVTLRTEADEPVVLRACEKFMPYWQARVDGKPAKLYRCDYLFQGVHLPAGRHEVTLTYAPRMPTFWAQTTGAAFCAVALAALALGAVVRRPAGPA